MWKGPLVVWIWGCLAALGTTVQLDVSLDRKDSGFFIKPLFRGQDLFSLNNEEKHFVVTQLQGSMAVRASYGPFTAQQPVSRDLIQGALGNNQSTFLNNVIVKDLDISAHLVARTITQERPQVQVLFHASHLSDGPDTANGMSYRATASESKWCLKMHVLKRSQELTSVCVLSSPLNVCIAEVALPVEWWDVKQMQTADVFYSVYPIDENLECSSASNSIVPDKESSTMEAHQPIKSFISQVSLTHGQLTYQELKEDHHVLIYNPQKSFYPGSKVRIPVKLQAESDLQLFVIKLRVRHGLAVIGAQASNPQKWRIDVDVSHKKHRAMVTAYIHQTDKYSKTDRVQDVFDWILEVDSAASGEEPGRIVMDLEYEADGQSGRSGGSPVVNKLVADIQIQQDNTYTIVPVIKTTEIINTGNLTGRIENFPMRIYSISQVGKISDITEQTTCHSGDEQVLKVAESCNQVYLDGSETKGSPSVSVIAKYGRHTKFLFFRVWVPQLPLSIELSDSKLSQIKAWKVPRHQRRKTRGVEFGVLTHPDLLLREEDDRKTDYDITCHLRFQSSVVEVYAQFHVPDVMGRDQYLVHRKVQLRVTDLVLDKLRVADSSIAMLEGQVVEGLRPGRTEIQVVSRSGRVLGTKEVKVANDKVGLERLQADMVTGLDMQLAPEPELPGTLVARMSRTSALRKKYEEGVVDIAAKFSDGSTLPLGYFPPTDYFLDMDTLNNHVVAFANMKSADTPRVIALGPGKGELLKLALELGDACQRKKSRPLAVSYVYVDVDFTKDGEDVQNDAGHPESNQPSKRLRDKDSTMKKYLHMKNKDQKKQQPEVEDQSHERNEQVGGAASGNTPDDMDRERNENMEQTHHEAQQQPIVQSGSMTPLEIGMYVLLGVFCLAIVVFLVNCLVFVVRYRRRRKPTSSNVAHARDWVWIGRATLERNAISTTCSQALMPEADFNGNHNGPAAAQPDSNRSSTVSAGPVDRNSVVSTYKGSECSIRITTNPIVADDNGNPPPCSSRPVSLGNDTEKLPELNEEDRESLRESPQPSTSREAIKRPLPRDFDGINGNLSEAEWDYEAMGLSYDELMEYFDNLKESTA